MKYAKPSKRGGGTERFSGLDVQFPDALSFVWQYKEIFIDNIYFFNSEKDNPVIVDCGANIGMSALYFKTMYPNAELTLIEADPAIADVLKSNLDKNGVDFNELLVKAAWIDDDGVVFKSDGSDGGAIEKDGDEKIPSFNLLKYLENKGEIDFLKIDIEGAETEIFRDVGTELDKVQNLFLEYHSFYNSPQELGSILSVLSNCGFRFYLETINKRKRPFTTFGSKVGMDLQVNIFAKRQ